MKKVIILYLVFLSYNFIHSSELSLFKKYEDDIKSAVLSYAISSTVTQLETNLLKNLNMHKNINSVDTCWFGLTGTALSAALFSKYKEQDKEANQLGLLSLALFAGHLAYRSSQG